MLLPAPIHRLQLRLATSWRQRTVTLKAASFALVGVVNTIVDFGVFLLAREFFRLPFFIDWFDRLAEACRCGAAEKLALIPANVVAWAVAVSGSYVLNSLITFSAESGRVRKRSGAPAARAAATGIARTTSVGRRKLRSTLMGYPSPDSELPVRGP